MNIVIDTILDRWKSTRRTKISQKGWISGNAVCCEHRGQRPDKRGRGGIIVSGDIITYSCFNCGFTASYQIGRPLYPKMKKLLQWMGCDDNIITVLKLESLKNRYSNTTESKLISKVIPMNFPPSLLLSENIDEFKEHANYIMQRGFSPSEFPFLVSHDIIYRKRVIIPFIMNDVAVGYSARSIMPQDKIRYIMKMNTPFVFGTHFIKNEQEWAILTEGLFDALSVGGLAVMHNLISEEQTNIVNDLQKRVVVVPHLDEAGLVDSNNSLIQTALDNDWDCSFPEWECNDINEAYVKYGKLFVVKHIIDTTTNNHTTIQVKQKMLFNKYKRANNLWQ